MAQYDVITTIGRSTIQHGPHNNRVYLMKLHPEDCPAIISNMKELVQKHGYSKIFAKIPAAVKSEFIDNGFEIEATIPDFYEKGLPVFFMSMFNCPKRREYNDFATLSEIIEKSKTWELQTETPRLPSGWTAFKCVQTDIDEMALIYREVFPTYPFPIYEPEFLKKTMETTVSYYGIRDSHGRLIALSSADIDSESSSAEMTDFATLPCARGNHCGLHLLAGMDCDMAERGIRTGFTIARSISFGMNKVFRQRGYVFAGSLKKNTNIGGALEDMNVWYKHL